MFVTMIRCAVAAIFKVIWICVDEALIDFLVLVNEHK